MVLAILATAALAYSFMQTLVLPALPVFARAFHASLTNVAWIASAFFLSSSVSIPIIGRLGDGLGKVRVLRASIVVFGLATLAAAVAPSLPVLIACRALQGVGGAVFPLSFGIVRDEFPPARMAFGIGIVSAIFGIGSGVGFVMSGVVLELTSWRWLFVVALVPVVVALVLLPRLSESPLRAAIRPDWVGGALLSLGLLAVLVAVSEGKTWGWTSARTLVAALGGVALLAAWWQVERSVRDPMVDLEVFARPAIALLTLSTFLIGYAMFAVYTVLPGYAAAVPGHSGYGFAASPLGVGLFFLPAAVAQMLGGVLAGGAKRMKPLTVLRVGVAAMTAALFLTALSLRSRAAVYIWLGLTGAGVGSCLAVLGRLAVESVSADLSGIAGAINTLVRTIGGAVAGQSGAAVVTAIGGAAGYRAAFLAAGAGGVAALVSTAPLGHGHALRPRQAGGAPSTR